MRKGDLSVFSNNMTFGMLRESLKSHLDEDLEKDKDEGGKSARTKKRNKKKQEEKKDRETSPPKEFYDLYSIYKNSGFRAELSLN